ncbi:MAG: antitoxin family protein [Chloroflexota bacterium]|nr:antitoxin family protein [Chloroflexota bacterium]
MPQTVTAIYENGVLTPLEKVKLRKRQKVRVKITPLAPRKARVVTPSLDRRNAAQDELVKQRIRDSFGMWADRDDIGDAVEWINEIRAGWEERLKEIYKDA